MKTFRDALQKIRRQGGVVMGFGDQGSVTEEPGGVTDALGRLSRLGEAGLARALDSLQRGIESIEGGRPMATTTGPTPTIGRIVHYTLGADDAKQINRRRADTAEQQAGANKTGFIVHAGSFVEAGEVFPMLITRIHGAEGIVCGQVFLDGNDTLWTSARLGPGPGTYHWPQHSLGKEE